MGTGAQETVSEERARSPALGSGGNLASCRHTTHLKGQLPLSSPAMATSCQTCQCLRGRHALGVLGKSPRGQQLIHITCVHMHFILAQNNT